MKFSENLARFIRWVMRDTKFHKQYPCTVESQDGFGPVALTPDDPEIRGQGLDAVPLWHGIPGVEVKVKRGARVLLGFRAGDRERPYAALWESASVEQIKFAGGTQPIAREGDTATVFWPPVLDCTGMTPAGVFTGTITITSTSSAIIDSGSERLTG